MSSYLIPIFYHRKCRATEARAHELGGKGSSLAVLARSGNLIPDTWVIPVWVLSCQCDISSEDAASELHAASFPQALRTEIQQVMEGYDGAWMVRSSAVDEDGLEHSFAGQYASIGSARTIEDLQHAIVQVWASYFDPHVQEYRTGPRKGMAVVLQKEIVAEYAGVLFTQNPATGQQNELVIESAKGHGEQVVSASIVPGRSIFWFPKLFRSWIHASSHLIIQKKIEYPRALPTLALQREICRQGAQLEEQEGRAIDIEWVIDRQGRLYLVQMRPITTRVKQSERVLWTRQFLGERWSIPATELGWSEIDDVMNPLIDYRRTHEKYLGGEKATRLFQYSPFLNATVFRHLLFRFPKKAPMPAFFLEMLPIHEQKKWTESAAVFPSWKVYASIVRITLQEQRWKRFRWNPWTNYKKWDGFQLRLEHFLNRNRSPLKSMDQAQARLQACRDMTMEYLKVHVCSLIYANLWHQWAVWYLKEHNQEDLIPIVVRAHRPTATQRANSSLWRLGNGQATIHEVLEDFGVRSDNSWSLFAERWCEVPEHVQTLASWMKGTRDPEIDMRATFLRLEKEMLSFPYALRTKMRTTQTYLFLREEQRFFFEKLLWVWKQTWLWLEKKEGFLLRHLSKEELETYWEGELQGAQELVLGRHQRWKEACEEWSKNGPPNQFLIGDTPIFNVRHEGFYSGIGISSGYAHGKVCIVRSIHDAQNLEEGDILVVPTLEPGWTSLLLKARGIVLELGGMLSHGAVIAREYGVPAVAAVERACSLFEQGENIALDGSQGTVWRCGDENL